MIAVIKVSRLLEECDAVTEANYKCDAIWLNNFCLELTESMQSILESITDDTGKRRIFKSDVFGTMSLCLMQIVICMKQLARVQKMEESGSTLLTSRRYFFDRMNWCLSRLRTTLMEVSDNESNLEQGNHEGAELTIVELMDITLNLLEPYSTYADQDDVSYIENTKKVISVSKQIRSQVESIIGLTLSFANVAMQEDKKALSALCQKVFRESVAFEQECKESDINECSLKMRAIALENGLYNLEDFTNKALLRLVYVAFLDHSRFSIDTLRTVIRLCDSDDPALDELIADFDVNLDRTIQIGLFAIAYASNNHKKSIIQSCLASLESLDPVIIPSLQINEASMNVHSEILEQHFNEEIAKFKLAVQEIIDSQALINCYIETLTLAITQQDRAYNKKRLQELVQMGEFLCDHFQIEINYEELSNRGIAFMQLFSDFVFVLRECKATLVCAEQIESLRILKRFKLLLCILRKLHKAFSKTCAQSKEKHAFADLSSEGTYSDDGSATVDIYPSRTNILYASPEIGKRNNTFKENRSRMPQSPLSLYLPRTTDAKTKAHCSNSLHNTVTRKSSLRTKIFTRRLFITDDNVTRLSENKSNGSAYISDIFDQSSYELRRTSMFIQKQ